MEEEKKMKQIILEVKAEDTSALVAEANFLREEISRLEETLAGKKTRLKEIEGKLFATEKQRAKAFALLSQAASLLGIDPQQAGLLDIAPPVPPARTRTPRTGGKCSCLRLKVNGKLIADHSPGTVLAHASKDCGGKGTDGRLTIAELIAMVGEEKYREGGWKVTLPNGKVLEGVMVQE